jgi:hypothetical protein
MTQHALTEQTQEDEHTMRSLLRFVGLFAVFSVFLALGVAFFSP